MMHLETDGSQGTLPVTATDTIYLTAMVDGRSRDLVMEVFVNDQVVSSPGLQLNATVPASALTGPATLKFRRNAADTFAASFNPMLQIRTDSSGPTTVDLVALDIAGRHIPEIATLEIVDASTLQVTRTIRSTATQRLAPAAPAVPAAPPSAPTPPSNTTGSISGGVPRPTSVRHHDSPVAQWVRQAVNRREETGGQLPRHQWNIVCDTSASMKPYENIHDTLGVVFTEILSAPFTTSPTQALDEQDWIGRPQLAADGYTLAITDAPFTASPSVVQVVLSFSNLGQAFAHDEQLMFLHPDQFQQENLSAESVEEIVNTVLSLVTTVEGR